MPHEHADKEKAVQRGHLRASLDSAGYLDLLPERLLKKIEGTEISKTLTKRELAVVFLASHGLYNKEIGTMLGISLHTVNNHFKSSAKKLGGKHKAHTVSVALRGGLFY
jgi:DNA-binding CsgD family transcriptional regulator